jgi:hypothetical protein
MRSRYGLGNKDDLFDAFVLADNATHRPGPAAAF